VSLPCPSVAESCWHRYKTPRALESSRQHPNRARHPTFRIADSQVGPRLSFHPSDRGKTTFADDPATQAAKKIKYIVVMSSYKVGDRVQVFLEGNCFIFG
jgi:hypothetical protein